MGIFTRFKDIVNANINSLLDKAEDPEKMLKLMIQEMEDTIIDLKVSCSARLAEEIRVGATIKETEETITRWENRARLALEKGKEDLAREALLEKRNANEKLARQKEHLLQISEDVKVGKSEITTLEDKLDQAKAKLKILQEREAKANKTYTDYASNLNARFEDMEDKINRMDSFNSFNKREESNEEKFSKMERDQEIEAELEKLKKENKK